MAIDFDAALSTITDIQNKVEDMYRLASIAKRAKVEVEHLGDIPFTSSQKIILKDKYETLKSELQTLFGQLP